MRRVLTALPTPTRLTPRWRIHASRAAAAGLGLALVTVTTAAAGSSGNKPMRVPSTLSRSLTATLTGSGTVQAAESLDLSFPSQGRITAIDAGVGNHVERGQVLAQIDPSQAKSTYASAMSNLAQSRAKLAQLKGASNKPERTQATVAAEQSQLSLKQATRGLTDATAQANLDVAHLQTALDEATARQSTDQDSYNADKAAYDSATTNLANAKNKLSSDQSTSTSHKLDQDELNKRQAADQAQLQRDQDQLAADQAALQKAQADEQSLCPADPGCAAATATRQAADAKVASDQSAIASDRSRLADDAASLGDIGKTLTQDNATVTADQAAVTDAQTAFNEAKSTLDADQTKLDSDKTAVETAQQSLDSGRLKAEQSLHNAQNALDTAKLGLAATKAANAVKAHPAKAGDLASAKAAVDSAKAAAQAARAAVEQTTLRAPVTGTIAAVNGQVGELSGSGGGGTGGESGSGGLITMLADSGFEVQASFSEIDAAKLRAGQSATAKIHGLDNEALPARIVSIDPVGSAGNGAVSFKVTFALERVPSGLMAGMTATVSVTVDGSRS